MSAATLSIVPLEPSHWPAVKRIYEAGIATGHATFETSAPSWDEWDASHLAGHRLVALDGAEVVGWVAVSAVSDRCVYGGVVESSVYVSEHRRGEGVGRLLLDAAVASTEADGIWTIQAGIFPENHASVALHERAGFVVVGRRKRLGRLGEEWRDVLLLERRSEVVG
jgi:L-amino acid N-acyltransferase YncA